MKFTFEKIDNTYRLTIFNDQNEITDIIECSVIRFLIIAMLQRLKIGVSRITLHQ